MMACAICGAEFDRQETARLADEELADLIGGELGGEHCDDCALVLISGTPEQIADLLGSVAPP